MLARNIYIKLYEGITCFVTKCFSTRKHYSYKEYLYHHFICVVYPVIKNKQLLQTDNNKDKKG